MKWILRYKPIAVIDIGSDGPLDPNAGTFPEARKLPSFLSNINEQFALQCAFLALEVDVKKVSPKKLEELTYCLRFRPFDESAYFMILSKDYLYSKDYAHSNEDS